MSKIQLTIDREFRDLCPSSNDEELRILRESIKTDGCRDAIVYWSNGDNQILDGHQRHTLCQQEKKPFETHGIRLPDREAAMQWILRNQLGRRNLTDAQRHILRGKLYNRTKGEQGGDHKSKGQIVPLIDTASAIAATDGVDSKTVKRDGQLAEAVEKLAAPVAKAVEQGEIPMRDAAALAELPKAEQKEVVAAIKSGEAENVREAIEALREVEPPEPEKVKDGMGKTVPERFNEVFDRGSETFKKALSLCAQLKKAMNTIAADEVIGTIFASKGTAGQACRDLDNVRNALRFAAPYAVCPYCKGKGCEPCFHAGWVGERVYDGAPSEKKK